MHEWVTGYNIYRSGLMTFAHIVRCPTDPERVPRSARKGKAAAWRQDMKAPVSEWESSILRLMADGQSRTFNKLILELTDYSYTADVAFQGNPDKAIWSLVKAERVEHTLVSPILFRSIGRPTTCNPKRRRYAKEGSQEASEGAASEV